MGSEGERRRGSQGAEKREQPQLSGDATDVERNSGQVPGAGPSYVGGGKTGSGGGTTPGSAPDGTQLARTRGVGA